MRGRIQLAGIFTAMTLLTSTAALAQTPPVIAPQDLVVVEDRAVLVVDPATGETRSRVGPDGALFSAIAGADGIVYVSVWVEGGDGTDVLAARPPTTGPELIGRVPGLASAAGLAPTGDRLQVLTYPDVLPAVTPTGVTHLPLPDRWRAGPPRHIASRDVGGGVLSADGRRWYDLRTVLEGERLVGVALRALVFREGEAPTASSHLLPMSSGYFALLMAPDGRTLYAVDYGDRANQRQTVHVVDGERLAVVRSVGVERQPTKGTLCRAALSPEGDRLYLASPDGNAGDGIIVLDTASWERVAHLLPGEAASCVAASPDGRTLYAATCGFRDLVTIDTRTWTERRRVPLEAAATCPWLLTVVSAG